MTGEDEYEFNMEWEPIIDEHEEQRRKSNLGFNPESISNENSNKNENEFQNRFQNKFQIQFRDINENDLVKDSIKKVEEFRQKYPKIYEGLFDEVVTEYLVEHPAIWVDIFRRFIGKIGEK